MAGGAGSLINRAYDLRENDLPLACHLAEWAALAAPEDVAAQQCVIDIFNIRAEGEISLMGRGIFSHAVRQAQKALAALSSESSLDTH